MKLLSCGAWCLQAIAVRMMLPFLLALLQQPVTCLTVKATSTCPSGDSWEEAAWLPSKMCAFTEAPNGHSWPEARIFGTSRHDIISYYVAAGACREDSLAIRAEAERAMAFALLARISLVGIDSALASGPAFVVQNGSMKWQCGHRCQWRR